MDKLIEKIISSSKHRKIPKDTLLLQEGVTCDCFVYIKSGIVRHFFNDQKGNEITKNFIEAPACFLYSVSSFLSQTPSRIMCEALSDVELFEVNHNDFFELLNDSEFLTYWNTLLSKFVIKKEMKEISMLKDSALQRYENFLKDFPGLLNRIPHYFIASYLSISPETLSRIRKQIS
jgi:CRP-like cAMP-binding protein